MRRRAGHPGYAWFYSREKINERLGFETYHFLDGYYENLLTDENSLDGHPNDETFFAERAESWEARDPSKPRFSFSVSYQGHSPYADDTLVWGETYIPHEGISDAAYYTVNNYLGSVASTGKQLAAYVDSFRDDPEPVVLVFFGDHKPTLGAGNSFYEELGVNVQEGSGRGLLQPVYHAVSHLDQRCCKGCAWKKRHWHRPDHLAVLSHVRAL